MDGAIHGIRRFHDGNLDPDPEFVPIVSARCQKIRSVRRRPRVCHGSASIVNFRAYPAYVVYLCGPPQAFRITENVIVLPPAASRLFLSVCTACLGFAGQAVGQEAGQAKAPGMPPVAAPAGLVTARFDSREIKAEAEPGAAVVELCYEFTNTGDMPLAVEEFSHSCGCMQGAWDGVPVEPGARGKITARLLTKGLRGTVRKALHVKFFEAGVVELIGEVRIPEALVYSAQTLRWTVGGEPQPKRVDIRVNPKTPVRVLSVVANDPAFSCELLSGTEAGTYQIVITPRDTATARICVLQVRTDSKDPRDALHGLFALVENSGPKGVRP